MQQGGAGAQVGDLAPQLTARAIDGRQVQLPSGRPTTVFFFAGWCGSCVPEAAALGQLQREQAGRQVDIVAVDLDRTDTAQTIVKFLQAAGNPR